MWPAAIAAMAVGGLASTAMGAHAANQVSRASAQAYQDYGNARNTYASGVANIEKGQEAAGKQTQSDWSSALRGNLASSPDMGAMVSDAYGKQAANMQQAGIKAGSMNPGTAVGSGKTAWQRALANDQAGRQTAANAPGAFSTATHEGQQAEQVRQMGLSQQLGDITRQQGYTSQEGALSRQFAYEPMSLAQARLGPAMQQAGMAGNQSSMYGSLMGLGGSVGGTAILAGGAK